MQLITTIVQMSLISETLFNFVKGAVTPFDESHDLNHAVTVTNAAHKIMLTLDPTYDRELLSYMAMLHDVRDHKYPKSISEEELVTFIRSRFSEEKLVQIMYVIENLSWSKEASGKRKPCPPELLHYLIAVGDADRLEAIGKVGLKRCYEFGKAKNPDQTHDQLVERVVEHCHEKLLRLYMENFIVSDYARTIAHPLHLEIVEFLNNPFDHEF